MFSELTKNEIERLNEAKTEHEWNDVCDAVKAARDGNYPRDWYSRVVRSGLLNRKAAEFKRGGPDVG